MRYHQLTEDTTTGLPDDVSQAFEELGDLQRGKPESAMLRVQRIMGGGVLNPVVEHVGDITHRISHHVRYGGVYGRDKIDKTLRWLSHPYGFEREMRENIANNAREQGISPDNLQQAITRALRQYAQEHSQLPVYNRTQWLAREAAVAVGMEDFDTARECLGQLKQLAGSDEELASNAMKFTKDANGKLLRYTVGSDMD